jgi:hypothetical protein
VSSAVRSASGAAAVPVWANAATGFGSGSR